MWTHLQPYIEASFTDEAIEHRARVSLSRAINLRRLVAFTGSGTTMPFGFPAWGELGVLFLKATATQVQEAGENNGEDRWALQRMRPQIEQLRAMVGLKGGSWHDLMPDKGGSVVVKNSDIVIELCEAVLAGLPDDAKTGRSRLWLARRDFATGFRGGPDALGTARLQRLFSGFEHVDDLGDDGLLGALGRIAIGEDPAKVAKAFRGKNIFRGKAVVKAVADRTGKDDIAVAALLQRIEAELPRKQPVTDNKVPVPPVGGDIVDALVNTLGIDRYLTMNYDVQLERAFLARSRRKNTEPDLAPFVHLCSEKATERDDPRSVTIEDGLRRAARSATLAPGQVGAMISFAAFARTYERQVFHLHGRLDDPANIVLTHRDYRRVYLADDDAEKAFLEAQEVTFGGNDFLFVGVGMSEPDVLRPFRRFVSRGVAPDQAPRGIFCLMPQEHDADKNREARNKAIEWIVRYDAYTLFYGDEAYLDTRRAIDTVRECLDASKRGKESMANRITAIAVIRKNLPDDEWKHFGNWISKDYGFLDPKNPSKVAADALLREVEGRLKARALVAELTELRRRADRWWKAYRTTPRERQSIYSRITADDEPTVGPVTARHRVTGHGQGVLRENGAALWPDTKRHDWSIIRQIRQADFRDKAIERNKGMLRIMRLTLPRGGGKGSLIQLLMQKENREDLFGHRDTPYADSFIAHLSFSMEFNSVLRAFSRFIAARIAEIQVRPVRAGVNAERDSIIGKAILELAKKRKQGASKTQIKGYKPTAKEWNAACNSFVDSRRKEPELALEAPTVASRTDFHATRGDGSQQVRRHRLETLRLLLTEFERIASEEDRVFVCLSSLDRICDASGNGHNPVHRAFFRLITASADTGRPQPKPPIDLMLIAGNPDVPIRYLSREVASIDDVPIADQPFYATVGKGGVALKRWPTVDRASWRDRIYLTPLAIDNKLPDRATLDAVLEGTLDDVEARLAAGFGGTSSAAHYENRPFRRVVLLTAVVEKATARLASGGVGVRGVYRQITNMMLGNAALTGLVMTLWARMPDPPGSKGEAADLAEFLRKMDAAAARYPEAIYEAILSAYRSHDVGGRWRTLDIVGPMPLLGDTGLPEDHDQFDPDIFILVLRHLALFSLPVEPWVLTGCPILLNEIRATVRKEEGGKPAKGSEQQQALDEWNRRGRRLEILRVHLTELVRRGLVIEVAPSVHSAKCPNDEKFIHQRFSVHARLREYLAGQMRLSVVDEGDSNHHQLSIYCDQPRDLPTPSRDHFRMVRDILDHQIARCRHTLELFYTLRPYLGGDEAAREKRRGKAIDRAARVLFAPGDPQAGKAVFAGHLGDIHAVPQRLRGCYSLLRGAFSLGAISRLGTGALSAEGEPPFESYDGWLRSLCNAAIGLEWNRQALDAVLDTSAFRDDVDKKNDNRLGENKVMIEKAQESHQLLFDNRGAADPKFVLDVTRTRRSIYTRAETLCLRERQRVSAPFTRIRHPLYRDEIAWTFNERGLTALAQGRIFDAVPLLGIARRIVEHSSYPDEEPHFHHAAEHRIVLNLAIAQIERGRVGTARTDLERLERQTRSNDRWTPNPLNLFAKGYLALCDHLSGSLQRAHGEYETVIADLVLMKRLRPVSIFNAHLADLMRAQGKLDRAMEYADLAIAAAAQAEQRDVQHFALNASARVLARRSQGEEAMARTDRVVDYACRMGIYGLQVEGELTRGVLMFDRGDAQLAGAATSRAIALATRYGMTLRRLRALSLYAEIQIDLGREEIAASILNEAKGEAERVGYQTQAARIAEILARFSNL